MRQWLAGILSGLSVALHSASPFFHAYVGMEWLKVRNLNYTDEQREAFLRGNIFPDIRYHANLSRESTHRDNVTLKEVDSIRDPFLKGVALHSYVDEERFRFIDQSQLGFDIDQFEGNTNLGLKMVEDEIVFLSDESTLWNTIIRGLRHYDQRECIPGLAYDKLVSWQEMMIEYFMQGPIYFFRRALSEDRLFITVPRKDMFESLEMMKSLKYQQSACEYVEKLRKHFKSNIHSFSRQIKLAEEKEGAPSKL